MASHIHISTKPVDLHPNCYIDPEDLVENKESLSTRLWKALQSGLAALRSMLPSFNFWKSKTVTIVHPTPQATQVSSPRSLIPRLIGGTSSPVGHETALLSGRVDQKPKRDSRITRVVNKQHREVLKQRRAAREQIGRDRPDHTSIENRLWEEIDRRGFEARRMPHQPFTGMNYEGAKAKEREFAERAKALGETVKGHYRLLTTSSDDMEI